MSPNVTAYDVDSVEPVVNMIPPDGEKGWRFGGGTLQGFNLTLVQYFSHMFEPFRGRGVRTDRKPPMVGTEDEKGASGVPVTKTVYYRRIVCQKKQAFQNQ